MLSDAMDAGVNPGGLQSRLEIRILLCYILANTDDPIPLDIVKEKMHFEGIANYFETAFAISELEENKNICVSGQDGNTKLYAITNEGRDVAENLGSDVPFSIRERCLQISREVVARRRNERENRVSKVKTENGVYVTCSIMEKEMELVSVKILVPDDETAGTVENRFLDNPMETLINATSVLIGAKI